jgi:hypothetical protein
LRLFEEFFSERFSSPAGRVEGASFLNDSLDSAVSARCMTAKIATKPSTTLDLYQFEICSP